LNTETNVFGRFDPGLSAFRKSACARALEQSNISSIVE